MASTRKSRNMNKRSQSAKAVEEWNDVGTKSTDAKSPDKSKGRKRKLSDMLGPQWSEDELGQFYEAYRRYGRDWKKVAAAVRNRSYEMVESLYHMNKAYLSLAEGTATVAGLIAMMTDHYNILGSESDRESNDVKRTSRKAPKRGRGKFRVMSKGYDEAPETAQHRLTASSYGCLSLLKKKRSGDILASSGPRAVGKRTPRIPVSNAYTREDRKQMVSPSKRVLQLRTNSADDEGLHVAALTLAEAYQRGDSPQISQTPHRTVDPRSASPTWSGEKKNAESGMVHSKFGGPAIDGDILEGSIGSREADNAELARDVRHPMDAESVDAVEGRRKVRKTLTKGAKSKKRQSDEFDDEREACSGTEEGPSTKKIREKVGVEIDQKVSRSSKVTKKRGRQLFFGDESSGLDALQTLADLSLNILLPACTGESESSAQVKEENRYGEEKPGVAESLSENLQKAKMFGKKDKGKSALGVDSTRKSAKPSKGIHHDSMLGSGTKLENSPLISKLGKRKRKLSIDKISAYEPSELNLSQIQKKEVALEEGKKPSSKSKRVSQVSPSKEGKLVKPQVHSSISTIHDRPVAESVNRSTPVTSIKEVDLPSKSINRRKLNLQKALQRKELKSEEITSDDFPDKGSPLASSKDMLSHSLSSRLLRRWCIFEWFYSAIDYPWFSQSEFIEYLNHVRLGHIPRLTRVEWGVIRSSLGKPRRLSAQFLKEERDKLEKYRESVRSHYAELRAGLREGLPMDLARPLSVGQRVIACHPKTREIHDGSILTVDRNRCRVQFDRPELGVEFVMDIDCMPLNLSENMPESHRRNNVTNRFTTNFSEVKLEGHMDWQFGSSVRLSSSAISDTGEGSSNNTMSTLLKQAKGDTIDAVTQAKATANEVAVAAQQAMYNQPCTLAQLQAREADIRALAELTRALDKKEALLVELRHMNEEVSGKQKDRDPIKDMENFRKQYAMVLLQLRDANDQVASALLYLRQRNTYQGTRPPWINPMEYSSSSGVPGSLNSFALSPQDSGSHVVEIVESSRQKARTMVATTLQAIGFPKEGEDALTKVGDVLTSTNKPTSGCGSGPLAPRPNSYAGNGVLSCQELTSSCTSESAIDSKTPIPLDMMEPQIPTELVSSCVATMLMIQSCAARQYPPAEVAQILDIAVSSLQPSCLQHLPIYQEIETCMGIIKNQTLALIPTPAPPYPDTVV